MNAIFGGMVYYCGWVWRFIASLQAAVKRLLSTTKAVFDHDVWFRWLKYPARLKMRISAFLDIAAKWLQNPEKLRFSIFRRNNTDSSMKGLRYWKRLKSRISAFPDISHILVWNDWDNQKSSNSQNWSNKLSKKDMEYRCLSSETLLHCYLYFLLPYYWHRPRICLHLWTLGASNWNFPKALFTLQQQRKYKNC